QYNIGVMIDDGATVTSTGSAALTIIGSGDPGTDYNYGVGIQGAGTAVTTVDGHVLILGTGGAGVGQQNVGVFILDGAHVASTGSAFVAVEWDALTLSKAGGAVTFHDRVLGQGLTVDPGAYAVSFLAGGDMVSAVTFNNTGGVTFGDDPTDVMNFDAGLTSTA